MSVYNDDNDQIKRVVFRTDFYSVNTIPDEFGTSRHDVFHGGTFGAKLMQKTPPAVFLDLNIFSQIIRI